MVTLSELTMGERARLTGFGATPPGYRRRLLALGITPGVVISVVRVAPLGCPVQIDVRGTALSLRKAEASGLEWERF
ncbi:ferrous iron transporter A [Legionella geestiana]|uniref:Ferrous iron transporter A n=1 Tax=Legionella geestiana TaxID=45065 RepID=A0A0W0U2S5_9GAMM|nr:FeoA family protein [Legionella geestiana]KTD02356.1 ferrous iron transporter A [Legionella geestiana]QBS12169.1 ferrous iron transport protein A [Legionella geestiana]STX53102.1 ferrous iron transporter A [Legionella geestiana]